MLTFAQATRVVTLAVRTIINLNPTAFAIDHQQIGKMPVYLADPTSPFEALIVSVTKSYPETKQHRSATD